VPVKKGNLVRLHYTGKFDNGEEFDSSKNGEPITFEVGSGEIIPGVDEAVVGMEVGETKEISVSPDKAYGERREDLIREFPRSVLAGATVVEGQPIQLQTDTGQIVSAIVEKLTDETVTFDFNHPLAGKVLHFELELVEIIK